ncbi:Processive diacylglycerol beta-glucosyltransferase [compost metagenome]
MYKERCNVFRNIWFFSAAENKILREFTISNQVALPYSSRDQGIVLHGGGWGIGTYREAKEMLLASHHRLTMLAYAFEEIENHERIAYCMNDPDWSPWSQDEQGGYTFPPFATIEHGREPIFQNQDCYPLMFDVIRSAKAIVSKPGGYSLFESFAAATPFVFLEPFAEHEFVNAEFWISQGFGIWFKQWEKEHFSDRCIEKLHVNLLDARNQISQGGQYNAT